MRKQILLLLTIFSSVLISYQACQAQCPSGSILFHNCAGAGSGGCISGCSIGVCTGAQITGDCSQQNMSVTIVPPTPACQMTVTGHFRNNPSGSSGGCSASGMDANDQLKVGQNAMVTGSSNFTATSTYAGAPGESITISGRSNRRDEVITYSVSCGGSCEPPLPVSLLYLNGELTNTGIILSWATASETNNEYYSVEYSNDGINFTEVMIIKGAGTTTVTKEYSAEIKDRFIGTTYFRLKQHDYDGKTVIYPQVFSLEKDIDNDFFISYQEEESIVHLNAYHQTSITMQIYNIIGNKMIDKTTVDLKEGEHAIPLKKFASGMYVCSILMDNKIYSKKFIVQ